MDKPKDLNLTKPNTIDAARSDIPSVSKLVACAVIAPDKGIKKTVVAAAPATT